MRDGDILILKGQEVLSLLDRREREVVEMVRGAYETHARGKSALPHSLFLHFPDRPGSRIIALPTYLGGDFEMAGVKWVASFPSNLERGIDRASAVVVLNSPETGRPQAIIEGSIISAKRTAASAALAASLLHKDRGERTLALLGCGPINFEVARFVRVMMPEIDRLVVCDLDPQRAEQFKEKCQRTFGPIEAVAVKEAAELLASSSLVSLATTAGTPHINDLGMMAPGSTILHVSLRDLSPEMMLLCDNIVDDIDHVCRAQTSIHLTEQLTGNREFVRGILADVANGALPARSDERRIAVFSPFGLGVLDMAVAKFVCHLALEQNCGTVISSFLPVAWSTAAGDSQPG